MVEKNIMPPAIVQLLSIRGGMIFIIFMWMMMMMIEINC